MLRLPPLTRVLLITVIICSIITATLRYHTYYLWAKNVEIQDKQALENSSSEQLGDGKNFPPDQKNLNEIPNTSQLYVPFLTIVPGKSHYYYPWILITASFVEDSILALIFTASTLVYGARYCENVWGSKELGRFVLLQTIIPNLIALMFYSLVYSITDVPSRSVVTICGSTAMVSGFLVAFKQLVPEHLIVLFRGLIKFKVKHLPMAFLIASTLMGFMNDLYAIHAWTGFFTSWIYLRYIRVTYADPVLPFNNNSSLVSHEHTTPGGVQIKGDASDSFALCEFFPEPFKHVIDKLSEPIFGLFIKLGIVRAFTQSEIDSANIRAYARVSSASPQQSSHYQPIRTRRSARELAEHRRSLALRGIETASTPLPSPPPATAARR